MSNISPSIWQSTVMDSFAAFWKPRHPTIQIESPNRPFDRAKVPDIAFIEWAMAGDPAGQTRYSNSVANNFFSRIGTWTFTANLRTEEKTAEALDLLDDIGLFYETAVLDGGYFRAIGTPIPLGDDGVWTQVSLSSSWIYFTDRTSILP